MSGHSKWSQIKRQKGTADVKRGAAFSKLSNAIIAAARTGGDPNTNFTLKMAVEKAKNANMPKETIERAVKRGSEGMVGVQLQEALYEVIGPENIGIIIEVITDNKNRTASELKGVLNKFGGKLATSGAVTYQFEQMGKLTVDLEDKSQEEVELEIIDAGAEDFIEMEGSLVVYTKTHELEALKKTLENQGYKIEEAAITWEPTNMIEIRDENLQEKIIKLMDALDNLEDVTAIHTNFDIK